MKEFKVLYITPLAYIINVSISQGHFPDELKLAKVIPIYKSDEKQSIENDRPISVLSFFSKKFVCKLYMKLFLKRRFIEINKTIYRIVEIKDIRNTFRVKRNEREESMAAMMMF